MKILDWDMLKQAKNIFIVGIKGVAMANLALIFKKMGKNVFGSDVDEEFITEPLLRQNRIEYITSFNRKYLPKKTDLIIYSAAHGGANNPQIVEAKERGIRVASQGEVLGKIIKDFKIKVAVCGSHGKTTTASLLSYALINLGKRPSYLVGAPSFNNFWGADYHQESDYFIVEADEYGVNPPVDKTPKFNFLDPDFIICTNIDFDHPDVYRNLDEVKRAFLKFFDNKRLFLSSDDKNLISLTKHLPSRNFLTFHDYLISHQGAVSCFLSYLGFDKKKINKAIKGFSGAKRRFERLFKDRNISLYDDYAHHPREIKMTILAARKKFSPKRIIVIFQPHTYSRTKALLHDFAASLSVADKCFILPIFASAREKKDSYHISSNDIVKINPSRLTYISSKQQLLHSLKSTLRVGDIIFTMGAGDVYKLKDDIIKTIKEVFNCQFLS